MDNITNDTSIARDTKVKLIARGDTLMVGTIISAVNYKDAKTGANDWYIEIRDTAGKSHYMKQRADRFGDIQILKIEE